MSFLFPDRFRLFPARSGRRRRRMLLAGRTPIGGVAPGNRVWDMDTSFLREPLGPLMSRKEAARYLTERGMAMAPQTLARKFCEGTGPLCSSLNRRAIYYRKHLDEWFNEQLAAPRLSSSAPRHPVRRRGAGL